MLTSDGAPSALTLPKEGGLLVDRAARACSDLVIDFNKGTVAKVIRRDLQRMASLDGLPDSTRKHALKLFESLRQHLPPQGQGWERCRDLRRIGP